MFGLSWLSLTKLSIGVVLAAIVVLIVAKGAVATNSPYYEAASILRGEAPEGCVRCRELTACALVDDMNKGVHLRSRWYGWRSARETDIELIEQAINNPSMCRKFPPCRFVGNGRDMEVWARKGWIDQYTRITSYCNRNGCTVCVPVVENTIKPE